MYERVSNLLFKNIHIVIIHFTYCELKYLKIVCVLCVFLSVEDPCEDEPCGKNETCIRDFSEPKGYLCECDMGFIGDCGNCSGMFNKMCLKHAKQMINLIIVLSVQSISFRYN